MGVFFRKKDQNIVKDITKWNSEIKFLWHNKQFWYVFDVCERFTCLSFYITLLFKKNHFKIIFPLLLQTLKYWGLRSNRALSRGILLSGEVPLHYICKGIDFWPALPKKGKIYIPGQTRDQDKNSSFQHTVSSFLWSLSLNMWIVRPFKTHQSVW